MKTVKRGDTGADVLALQAVLNAQGIVPASGMPVEIDGVFGPETEECVKYVQRRAKAYNVPGVEVDGICGPITWQQLITERG